MPAQEEVQNILLRGTDTNFGVLLPEWISFKYQTSYCMHKHEFTVLLLDKTGQTVICLLSFLY